MTPEEIATHLLTHHDHPDFAHILAQLRPHLNMEVMTALAHQLAVERRRNAQHAAELTETVVKAVAVNINSPEAKAYFTWVNGTNFLHLNRYHDALTCFQSIEPFYQKQGELLNVAAMQINQVIALRELGEYQQVLILADQARNTCKIIGEPAEQFLANLECTLGWVYEEMGDTQAALDTYHQARKVYEKLGRKALVALIDVTRAHAMQSIDRFDKAKALLLNALPILEEVNYTQEIARTNLNLGNLSYQQGHYQQALHYLETAHIGFSSIPLPVEIATVTLIRSWVYLNLNLMPEMMGLAIEAEVVFKREKMHREHVRCLMNLAAGYQRLDVLEKAEKSLAQARRKLHQQKAWWKLWRVDLKRAQLAFSQGQVATATRIARRTENRVNPAQHPSLAAHLHLLLAQCVLAYQSPDLTQARQRIETAVKLAQTYHLTEIHIRAYTLQAHIYELNGDQLAAWQSLQQAIKVSEQLRLYLSQDELQVGFMVDKLPLYEEAVRLAHLLVKQGRLPTLQFVHALNLAHTAPLPHLDFPSQETTLTPEEQAQLHQLRQRWQWFQNKVETADTFQDTPQDQEQMTQTRQNRHQIELEMAELMRRQRLREGDATRVKDANAITPENFLTALQNELGVHETLLHYYVVNGRWQALLITQTDIKMIPDLVTSPTLKRLWQTWRFHVQHLPATLNLTEDALKVAQAYLSRLHQVLISPLMAYLDSLSHIFVIIPPGWHELPLAAMFDGTHYLTEQYYLTYLSAPAALLTRRQWRGASPAKPILDKPQALVMAYSENGRLPHTIQEAQQIKETLSPHWQVTQLLEEAATAAAFRQSCQESQLLHIASHAVFRPDNPYFSWIRLADDRLTVTDLYHITLPHHPLVVLSACDTGQGQPRGGGLLGMGRGFLAAGASGLILTLWRVSDTATATWMQHFYENIDVKTADFHIAWAVSQAQRQAITAAQHPFNWAGFIFVAG